MFDVFATILSAGVVISVVTLVVHEPLLLAAGISTILGLMFVLLPMFVAMVPALGYMLMFIGIVSLGYGVVSTRSWLITLDARRVAARARKRAVQAGRGREADVDSERSRSPLPLVAASLNAPLFGGMAKAPPIARASDDDASDDGATSASSGRNDGARGEFRSESKPTGGGSAAAARLGRGLGRSARRAAPLVVEDDDRPTPRTAGKPWRNPYERLRQDAEVTEAELVEVKDVHDSQESVEKKKQASEGKGAESVDEGAASSGRSAVAETSPLPPTPPPAKPLQPTVIIVAAPPPPPLPPVVAEAAPVPTKLPLSRGAERIQRIKEESRSTPVARGRKRVSGGEAPAGLAIPPKPAPQTPVSQVPVEPKSVEAAPVQPVPLEVASVQSAPIPPAIHQPAPAVEPVAVAVVISETEPVAVADDIARKRRRQRDLVELGLIDYEPEGEEAAVEKAKVTPRRPTPGPTKPAAKPFVSRLARRG